MKQRLGKRQHQKCFPGFWHESLRNWVCAIIGRDKTRRRAYLGESHEFSFYDLVQVIACEFQVFICKLGMITLGLLRRSNEITHAEEMCESERTVQSRVLLLSQGQKG